jgi:L-fuculose-phosphate aldolase
VLFADGVSLFEETPELIQEADQGHAVAICLGSRRVVIMRNHGVLVVGQDVPWAVLAAVTLERAVRMQFVARTLGNLRPMSQGDALRMHPTKYSNRLVADYWQAWIRKVRRMGFAAGMPFGD